MDEKPKTHNVKEHEGHATHEGHAHGHAHGTHTTPEQHGLNRSEKSGHEHSEPSTTNNTQNILAILLIISLLANVYFIISINDLNTKLSNANPLSYTTTSTGQGTQVTTQSTATNMPSTSGLTVTAGKIVKVDYIGKFLNGTLFDTSIQSEADNAGMTNPSKVYEPLRYVAGAGQMLDAFDQGVMGMKVGDEKTITIPAGQGYTTGPLANQTLVFWVKVVDVSNPQPVSVMILSDKRCSDCASRVDSILTQLKDVFPGIVSTQYDYSTPEGEKLYTDSNITMLPAFLFTQDVKNADGYSGAGGIQQFLDPAGPYLNLRVGSKYNPTCYKADGTTDCSKPECAKGVDCMAKTDKPLVEAFVMSYCPYGTQIEKGLIPVAELLGNKINFSIKFCDYSMHGQKEVVENLLQVCIQNVDNTHYLPYLSCFLNASDSAGCLKSANVDTAKVNACVAATDAEYNVTADYNDKSKWVSGQFPPFNVYEDLNTKYGVQGSPTFVLNGVVVDGVGRDPESLLTAICGTFKTKPAECSQTLSSTAPSTGFGYTAGDTASSSSGGCGT